VLVSVAEDLSPVESALHPDELTAALAMSPVRRRNFILGRHALRLALDGEARGMGGGRDADLGRDMDGGGADGGRGAGSSLDWAGLHVPVLADERGAPILPAGVTGSISHKGDVAAAIGGAAAGGFLGIDIERAAAPRLDIAQRILTERERALLPRDPAERGRAVTLRFAVKEAIYKAVHPVLRRYVGFTEVELDETGDTFAVSSALPLVIDVAWTEHQGLWLATARAVPR
jgi:4'-phosphopantetheinyl transferase EntD